MRTLKFHLRLCLLLLLFSCDGPEPSDTIFVAAVFNDSGQEVTITRLEGDFDPGVSFSLLPGESSEPYIYRARFFTGMQFGDVRMEFANGDGYVCKPLASENQFCTDEKNLVNSNSYILQSNGTYLYTITREEFLNAFDLP